MLKGGVKLVERMRRLFLPYDLFERHMVVGHLLQRTMKGPAKPIVILDVGGRSELLRRFVPYRVVSVNLDGSGDLLGSGTALPFSNGSFSAIVSIDTIEHLPHADRVLFLNECLRVVQHCLLVAAPFGSEGHQAYEKRLGSLHRSLLGESHVYLSEHIRFGLPGTAELDQLAGSLNVKGSRRYFAGDYVREGWQFERAMLRHRRSGVLVRLGNLWHAIRSWALFHPIRLENEPQATTNRFYWLILKDST